MANPRLPRIVIASPREETKLTTVKGSLGQRLLANTSATPLELRRAGLEIESVDRALQYRWCAGPRDFMAVLELRHSAYAAVGKVGHDSSPTEMAGRYDVGARILMAFHHDRLVGTARVAVPPSRGRTEYDDFARLPEWIDRDSLAVLSRIATDPRYRGSDLLYSLVFRSLAICRGQFRFVLSGCTRGLLPIYQRVGAKPTSRNFRHGTLGRDEHLIVFEPDAIADGEGVRPDLQALLHRCV